MKLHNHPKSQFCAECSKNFEREKSICPFCAEAVSNADFFRNNYHQTGKCRSRLRIPAKAYERTVDKPGRHPSSNPALGKVDYDWCQCLHTSKDRNNGLCDRLNCQRIFPLIENWEDLRTWWKLR